MTQTRSSTTVRSLITAALAATVLAGPAGAQTQTAEQQKCIVSLNKAGAKVALLQGKAGLACVKNSGKGVETDATVCLTADSGNKVGTAATKVSTIFGKVCGTLPDFGPTSAGGVADGAKDNALSLTTDLFGSDVTSAMILSTSDAPAAKCQTAVLTASQKLATLVVKGFNACKAAGFKEGSIDSATRLQNCVDIVKADAKAKLASAVAKLSGTLDGTCAGLDLADVFPGFCADYTNLEDCVVWRARCSACSVLAAMDGLEGACDGFDDNVPSNASCGTPLLTTTRVSLPDGVEPAETPGSPGVVVTNPKLLTQFPPSGPDLNRSDSVRWRLSGPNVPPDAILILVPGFGSGVNPLRTLAENLIPKMLVEKGIRVEVWGFSRRDDLLEDREGLQIAVAEQDPLVAMDWYYGGDLGLTLHPSLVAGPNRRAVFYNSSSDIPFLANFTPQVYSLDLDATVEAARAITPNVFLGGHSAGTGFAARYASTDLNVTGMGPADPAYAKLRGLVLFEGGGGTTAASAPLSADTIDRIVARADGGLFGAVRDNAARCVDGTTPCTIATEATACSGQVPPKCTLPTTSYTSIGGLKPEIYAAGEVGAVQALKDPESGQVILQVDQGSPGNNAIAMVPGLSPLAPPLIPASTVEGLFGIFLDDDGANANLLSPALATSLGESDIFVNGLSTWKDIDDGDGFITLQNRPNNGPAPTTLPGGKWGNEVEVTRLDRHIQTFIAGGENASDWYYAGSGLAMLSVSGVCSAGTCSVGKAGSCSSNSDCTQSISLDSSALSATRPDIANLTQAPSIDIPVISFGGSNGLTPIGASFLGFGQSIGVCTAPTCNGTARVVNATLPNPAFPTYGGVAGGYEVYISEGYAHVDVITAEDTPDNLIPERLADFLERNLQ